MRQRITMEFEGEEGTLGEISREIKAVAIGQAAGKDVAGYEFHVETVPGRISGSIQLPGFMGRDRVISGQEKGMVEAIRGRGMKQDG